MKFAIAFANVGPAAIVPSFLFWANPTEDLARYGDEVIAPSQA